MAVREIGEKIKNLICYCGLSHEDYRKVRKEAYTNNFLVWRYLHVLITLAFLVVFFVSAGRKDFDTPRTVLLFLIGYSAVVSVLMHFVLKSDSLVAQFLIYITMALLMVYALYASMAEPGMMAVTFIVMLVLLPMFMIDKPYWMAVFLTASVVIYLLEIRTVKDPESFNMDEVNCIAYGLLGIIINVFYTYFRMHQFLLQKHETEHHQEQARTAEESLKLSDTLKKTCEGLIEVMGDVVESRDPESGTHIKRVKGYTYILARKVMERYPEYGLDPYRVDLITSASALHDVGKITIRDEILNKPGKLTKEEFEIMKTHCCAGCRVLEKMRAKWSEDYLEMGLSICRSHHEKWDGKGYPDGLKGDEIPIEAQIVSLADIFDALTTKRVYKEAYPPEKAFEMILNGECGAFSGKMIECLTASRESFFAHLKDPDRLQLTDRPFELVSRSDPDRSFVLGFHDQDRTLRESIRLHEELSVLESLSEELLYVCYVDISRNEVQRYRADERIQAILDSFGEVRSSARFDRLMNTIIIKEDIDYFRKETEREHSMSVLREKGRLSVDFRIRLEDGLHFCRLRITPDHDDRNAVIIGIAVRDEEHAREEAYVKAQQDLAAARQEVEDREKLADRLAVIDCISSNYDYVCTLNTDTMEVVVYRAAEWIRIMFRNLEDIVTSPSVRTRNLQGIIHSEDFERFCEQSRHENVMEGLKKTGSYTVNYRGYKYGKLVNYQTRYAVDQNNPKRIVIGLQQTD